MTTEPTGELTLVSHVLCPYVQRAVIALHEKDIAFQRIDVDLADKPKWFERASPLGKVPLLRTEDTYLFESAPILEFLEDTTRNPLHPTLPVERARHRAYVEFGSQVLNGIGALYNAPDKIAFDVKARVLQNKFTHLESELEFGGSYFAGDRFSLVDAAFGPVFRYFDVFDQIGEFGIFDDLPRVHKWRAALSERPSVVAAVDVNYADLLKDFLEKRNSWIAHMLEANSKQNSA